MRFIISCSLASKGLALKVRVTRRTQHTVCHHRKEEEGDERLEWEVLTFWMISGGIFLLSSYLFIFFPPVVSRFCPQVGNSLKPRKYSIQRASLISEHHSGILQQPSSSLKMKFKALLLPCRNFKWEPGTSETTFWIKGGGNPAVHKSAPEDAMNWMTENLQRRKQEPVLEPYHQKLVLTC